MNRADRRTVRAAQRRRQARQDAPPAGDTRHPLAMPVDRHGTAYGPSGLAEEMAHVFGVPMRLVDGSR